MNMSKSFYNTIGANGQRLINYEKRAESQEEWIIATLKPNVEYTPYDVLDLYVNAFDVKGMKILGALSSVRRALTNLKEKGKIVETGKVKVDNQYSSVPNRLIKLK